MQQYVIYAFDHTDEQALDRRMAARPSHLEGVKKLKAADNFILGGAILDPEGKMIGSTMIMQFESEAGLRDWYDHEPYIQGKVWEKIDIRPFRVANV